MASLEEIKARMVGAASSVLVTAWDNLPAVGGRRYCLACDGGADKSDHDFAVAVGFGSASVSASGTHMFDEQESDDLLMASDVEKVASQFPDLDWRISLFGPLSEQEYQRQGKVWVLVSQGEGFA